MPFVVQDFSEINSLPLSDLPSMVEQAEVIKSMRYAFTMTMQRCYNEKCADYKFYGGRGIKVCDRWRKSFDNFLVDMGLRPEGMTLDRIDVNGDYTPENCKWSTRKQQTANRRTTVTLTYNGETKTLTEWAEITGISYGTLKARKQRLKYSDEECLIKAVKPGEKLEGRKYKLRKNPDKSVYPRGYNSMLTRFSKEEAETIRKEYENPEESFSSLARKYKVAIGVISDVCQYKGAYA